MLTLDLDPAELPELLYLADAAAALERAADPRQVPRAPLWDELDKATRRRWQTLAVRLLALYATK